MTHWHLAFPPQVDPAWPRPSSYPRTVPAVLAPEETELLAKLYWTLRARNFYGRGRVPYYSLLEHMRRFEEPKLAGIVEKLQAIATKICGGRVVMHNDFWSMRAHGSLSPFEARHRDDDSFELESSPRHSDDNMSGRQRLSRHVGDSTFGKEELARHRGDNTCGRERSRGRDTASTIRSMWSGCRDTAATVPIEKMFPGREIDFGHRL